MEMLYADLVLKSDAVFSGKSEQPFCGGVAIAGNRIIAVGDKSEIDPFIGTATKVFEFSDELIMPGFNDSHVHLLDAAIFNNEDFCIDLSGYTSEEESVAAVQSFMEKHPDNSWIFGRGWNHWTWDKPVMPTRTSLDKIVTELPICLQSWDLHSVWVNKRALEICGIDRNTPDPQGGRIVRFADGEPNGLLSEGSAVLMVTSKALMVSDEKLKSALVDFIHEANKLGITSVGDVFPRAVGIESAYDIFKELEDSKLLNVRIHFFEELKSNLSRAKTLQQKYHSGKLRFSGLKQLVDGVVEAHTAYLLEPYSDDPSTRGNLVIPQKLLEEQIICADNEGFSVRLHTIGDGAVRICLDAFEAARVKNGNKGCRHALEHIENIQAEDIQRLSKLGVVASMQPLHFTSNVDGYPVLLGQQRVQRAWAAKTILDSGAKYSFGSDVPVVDMNPILGIHTAVTRTTVDGYPSGGWNPKEKLSVAETLRGYTSGAAYVEGFENEIGTLEAGKLADIVVLNKNLFNIPTVEILDTLVKLTIMDGQIVYENLI